MKQLLKIVLPLLGKGDLIKYIILGMLSGLSSFLFINSVTQVIAHLVDGTAEDLNREYIIIFSFVILFFIWIRRTLSLAIINLSQKLFWTLRQQIISLVLKANYGQMTSRKDRIYSAIVNDVSVLTQASLSIIDFSTSLILAIACLVYLVSISWQLFIITVVIAATGIVIYHLQSKKDFINFKIARDLEDKFIVHFNSILNGFKEIFMEPKKGQIIFNNKIHRIANDAYQNNVSAFTGFLNSQITGQVLFYILISSILLFFHFLLKIEATDTISYVFTLLYLLGSIETIMVLIPALSRASVASNKLLSLKQELEDANFDNSAALVYMSKEEFQHITVEDLQFDYKDKDGNTTFGIGPIDFEINKGEIVFIYGGNGSGKTTFMQSLLGLSQPHKGDIKLNNIPITNDNYSDYRAVFAAVFSDYHLFNELLGIDNFKIEKWNYYLKLFEIEDKVELKGMRFSSTNLSFGQRKRLALIATLLEEKPVLVIDEWAADQDPYFRKKFYTEILPMLKEDGFTVFAITHDDKYYHCADKLYKMEEGKLIKEDIKTYDLGLVSSK